MLKRAVLKRLIAAFALLCGIATGAVAQSGYRIQPGDVLSIEVLEDSALNRQTLVLPDGSITFPLVGTVQAGGRTLDEVDQTLTSGLAPNFAVTPTVYVAIARLAAQGGQQIEETIATFIMGEVNAPGRKEVAPGTTILQLLAQSGGITSFAARRRIELRRTDSDSGEVTTYLFSYDGRANGPRIRGGTTLEEGDVVVVPTRGLFE